MIMQKRTSRMLSSNREGFRSGKALLPPLPRKTPEPYVRTCGLSRARYKTPDPMPPPSLGFPLPCTAPACVVPRHCRRNPTAPLICSLRPVSSSHTASRSSHDAFPFRARAPQPRPSLLPTRPPSLIRGQPSGAARPRRPPSSARRRRRARRSCRTRRGRQ